MLPTLKRLAQTLCVNNNIKPSSGETNNFKEKARKKKGKQEVTRKGSGWKGQPEDQADDDRGEKLTNEVRHALTKCISILAEARETTEFTLAHIPVIASKILGATPTTSGSQQRGEGPKPQTGQENQLCRGCSY